MFLWMPDTMVMTILCENGVKMPVDRDNVIKVTNEKLIQAKKLCISMFSMMPNTMVIPILCENLSSC